MTRDDELDDAGLLARAAEDVGALEVLYRRYVRRVAAFAARRCPSPDDVADVVAGTFDRLLRQADRYDRDRGTVAAFVFAIASSEAADQWRRAARQRALVSRLTGQELRVDGDEARIEAAVDAAAAVASLHATLDGLPSGEGAVLRLVADGLSPAEAATRLHITPNAARVRLARARKRLRARARAASTPVGTAAPGSP